MALFVSFFHHILEEGPKEQRGSGSGGTRGLPSAFSCWNFYSFLQGVHLTPAGAGCRDVAENGPVRSCSGATEEW